MTFLLDTHALLWWLADDSQLGRQARELVEDPGNDVLVSMGVITFFIPYLYLFASMFKLQSEPASKEAIRVPGGKPVAYALALVGFVTTTLTIALSVLPPADEPNKPLAVFKIVGGCGALVLVGVGLYLAGKRRAQLANASCADAEP